MKRYIVVCALALGFVGGPAWAEQVRVDNLSASTVGGFPKDWKTYPFHYGKAERVYKVAEEGGVRMIRAHDADDISVPIAKDFDWDLAKYPYFKFKWRAQKLPAGAREDSSATNDSPCAVYVGFGRTSALKYVWSTSLPAGSFWAKNPGKFVIISKESGPARVGTWKEETVFVKEDYERYFGKSLGDKTPSGVGIMSDGNAVHQTSACDYTDFRISTSP